MKEDRRYDIRFSSGLSNPWDFDLRGAGHLYVLPGKEYFLEKCPKSLLDVVISYVSAMNVSYRLTKDKKGCFQTVNCINYDINDPRSLLGKLRTNKIEEVKETEDVSEVEEPEVVEVEEPTDEVDEVTETDEVKAVEESTDDVEEPTKEVEESTDEIEESEVEEPTKEVESVEEDSTPEVTLEEVEGMSKPKLEELATSLGIESVQTKTKKKLKSEIINKLGL